MIVWEAGTPAQPWHAGPLVRVWMLTRRARTSRGPGGTGLRLLPVGEAGKLVDSGLAVYGDRPPR